MVIETPIGRVQPLFKGQYNSIAFYSKLDNVNYNGSTWICVASNPISNIEPAEGNYWTLVAAKGDTGDTGPISSFGTPTATASALGQGASPIVVVSASGDHNENLNFQFGIPAGPVGIETVEASASGIAVGSDPTAEATLSGNHLLLKFGIPGASGQGATSVDEVTPNLSGNVELGAVRTIANQGLSDNLKQNARNNINAQIAGDYIVAPSGIVTGQYLYYNNNNIWVGKSLNEVPTGLSSDNGKFLKYINNEMTWSEVYAVPVGGASGAPLIKHSNTNYDIEWGAIASDGDIDAIFIE